MRTKNIVLYGCDNSGKTTAANDIADILTKANLKCMMLHSPGPVSAEEMLDFMWEQTRDVYGTDVRVLDRFPCIEEFIYGPIIRGNNKLKSHVGMCNYFMTQVDLFIHCKPSIDVVENWGEREQMEGVKSNARKIYEAYDNISTVFKVEDKVVIYDWTKREEDGKSLKDILKKAGVLE